MPVAHLDQRALTTSIGTVERGQSVGQKNKIQERRAASISESGSKVRPVTLRFILQDATDCCGIDANDSEIEMGKRTVSVIATNLVRTVVETVIRFNSTE